MQWVAVMLILGLIIGLRRRAGPASYAVLVLGVAAVVSVWYLQLGPSG
jgi:hypothetical protein